MINDDKYRWVALLGVGRICWGRWLGRLWLGGSGCSRLVRLADRLPTVDEMPAPVPAALLGAGL